MGKHRLLPLSPKKLLALLYVCLLSFANAQDLDSVRTVLKNKKQDTSKVNILNSVGRVYIFKGKFLLADSVTDIALKLAQEIKFKKGIFNSNINKGVIYMYQDNFSEALRFYLAALDIGEDVKDKALIARATANVALIYENEGDLEKTLEFNFKALKLKEELKDNNGIRAILTNIGRVYKNKGEYENALTYFLRSLKLSREGRAKGMIALNLTEIGEVFEDKENTARALASYLEALKLAEEQGDKVLGPSIKEKIGSIYLSKNDFKKAEEFYLSGLQTAKEIGGLGNQRDLNEKLSELYTKQKKWELSYIYYKDFKELEDSIKNEKKTKELVSQQMNFEFDKKQTVQRIEQEKKDALAAEELDDHKMQRNYFILGFALILIVAVVVFRSYKQTQKAHRIIEAQKTEVEKQKDIVENQKHLIEEKHKEITDSINYAERIQRSFLATGDLLDENLKDYFVWFKPKDVVSGDFYWASKLRNGNFVLATADSTGHGVPGAIMSLLNITSLEKAIEQLDQPSEILDATRKIIINRLKKDGSADGGKDGMDCSLISFDFNAKKMWIAAANNPVWIVRGKETIEIKPDKMPVGKHDRQDTSFTLHEMDLQQGDVVYTLTDGFPDQFGGVKGKKFMIKNLRELLKGNAHLPMKQQKELLESTFKEWVGALEQVDDVTLIGVRM